MGNSVDIYIGVITYQKCKPITYTSEDDIPLKISFNLKQLLAYTICNTVILWMNLVTSTEARIQCCIENSLLPQILPR